METFQLLSRGGAKFDKKRFGQDVQLFQPKATSTSSSDGKAKSVLAHLEKGEIPAELDFFRYTTGGQLKGKGKEKATEGLDGERQAKKRKIEDEDEDIEEPQQTPQSKSSAPIQHRITCTGSNVPQAIERFADLVERYSMPLSLLKNLESSGYHNPTGIQTQGIPILLESRDLAAIAPTGSGKTLSYLLPIFSSLGAPASHKSSDSNSSNNTGTGVRALVLSPTRELAAQIYNECLKLAQGRKWKVVLYSKATGTTLAQKEVRDKTDIIISTPLRLVTALQQGQIELHNVRHLVFDEADRLLESGFLSQIEEIIAACTHPKIRKAVFSATLPAGIETVANSFLFDPIRVVVGLKDSAAANVKQSLVYVGTESGKLSTLRQLLASAPPLPLLIFVQSRERAAELHQELLYDGVAVDVLHAEMSAKQREEAIGRMRAGKTWVMVSTEVMARGMDFGGLKGVLNYDFPQSIQSYVHRIGRTGRAGRDGVAITYFTDADGPYLKSIATMIHQSGQPVPQWMLSLPKPSKMKKRQLKKVPVERKSVGVVAGRGVGKGEALRKKGMIEASKRRKLEGKDKSKKKGKRAEKDNSVSGSGSGSGSGIGSDGDS